jgi:hypothetical protein
MANSGEETDLSDPTTEVDFYGTEMTSENNTAGASRSLKRKRPSSSGAPRPLKRKRSSSSGPKTKQGFRRRVVNPSISRQFYSFEALSDVHHSKYTGKTVEIIVGKHPNQVTFTVQKELFVKSSKYFAAAFDGGFAGSVSGKLYLPEESPKVFNRVIEYIYAGKCPWFGDEYSKDDFLEGFPPYVHLFLPFEKYQLTELRRVLSEDFEYCDLVEWGNNFSPQQVSFCYANTLEGSALRDLMARVAADQLPNRIAEAFHLKVSAMRMF